MSRCLAGTGGPGLAQSSTGGKKMRSTTLPGSSGEHTLQDRYGTESRALAFYDDQMLDRLNAAMVRFIGRMEMMWVATSDRSGACDSTFRAGPPGFVAVADPHSLYWPEYRGNGVLASQGNIVENPHVGLLFLDFFDSTVGLHINGAARLVDNADLPRGLLAHPAVAAALAAPGGRHPERFIGVTVEEAYIHCAKHVPRLVKRPKTRDWGTDNAVAKGGDFFQAAADARRDGPSTRPAGGGRPREK